MIGGPQEHALRVDLIRRAKGLYEQGLLTALEGNLSVRFGGRWVLATPSSRAKSEIEPKDLVLLDLGAASTRGGAADDEPRVARAQRGRIPSSELQMHLAIYAARPDIQAVVHAHPPTAVGLTFAKPAPRLDICPEAVVFLGDIPTAPYATPGTEKLAESILPFLSHADVILMERHGAVCAGSTLDLAYYRMEALESLAKIYLTARQLGPVVPLPDTEQKKLKELAQSANPGHAESLNTIDSEALMKNILARLDREALK